MPSLGVRSPWASPFKTDFLNFEKHENALKMARFEPILKNAKLEVKAVKNVKLV